MWHVYAFLALLAVSSAAAFAIGGAPERLVGITLLAAVALSQVSHALPPTFIRADLALLAIDAATAIVVGAIAIRADRFWPIWAATLLVQTVLGHALRIADPTLFPWLYWLTCTVWAWPIQTVLLIGSILHHRRPRARSWSDFSSPSLASAQAGSRRNS